MQVRLFLCIFAVCIALTNAATTGEWIIPYEASHGCIGGAERCSSTVDVCYYTRWSRWSNCSDICSPLAEKIRTRTCLTDTCDSGICPRGETSETRLCWDLPCCEGFPKWAEWGAWDNPCGSSCGLKHKSRTRRCLSCNNLNCEGPSSETEICPEPCPKKCIEKSHWNNWSAWGKCVNISRDPPKCTRVRKRTCSTRDCLDGSLCEGVKRQTSDFEYNNCFITAWRPWESWSDCDIDKCNTFGNRTRTRLCPPDKKCIKEQNCIGHTDEIEPCIESCCSGVSLSWTEWGEWSNCTHTCGSGTQTRKRKCQGPKKCLAQQSCHGEWKETRLCFNWCCKPKQVKLGQWSEWSTCKEPCGGVSRRKRKCKAKKCQLGKKQCASMKKEKRPCPKCK